MVSRIPSVVFPWRPGAELQVGEGIPDLQPDAVREAPPLNARTGSPRPQRVIGHDPDGLPADVGTGRASTTLSACARSAFRWDTSERFDQEYRGLGGHLHGDDPPAQDDCKAHGPWPGRKHRH